MLDKILPKHVFDKVVNLKAGKPLHAKPLDLSGLVDNIGDVDGGLSSKNKHDSHKLDAIYDSMLESLKKSHAPEQVEAILGTIEREQQEVMEMVQRDGGDLDEIIATVRERTRQRQREILEGLDQYRNNEDKMREAEIVSDSQENNPDLKPKQ
jgi:uncharacterized protein YqgV (UPF0045/DUF77 family)